ncbi:hypothetical protein IHE45_13G088200 [Dioscorea alata]|uniref:Uncharacterized protein n=1 Tax=Dioscorea alata TaxID=55571 RepID=A0ACB7UZA2_DIOAL|nr:hypothetical protein IHE45_13G088200 [Dioscorea alata]
MIVLTFKDFTVGVCASSAIAWSRACNARSRRLVSWHRFSLSAGKLTNHSSNFILFTLKLTHFFYVLLL